MDPIGENYDYDGTTKEQPICSLLIKMKLVSLFSDPFRGMLS